MNDEGKKERNVKIWKIRYLDWGWFDIQAETSRTITEGMRPDENRFGVFPNKILQWEIKEK